MTRLMRKLITPTARRSRPVRFYILPKIQKNKDNPRGRPIVSATSHPTEHISQFVDAHLNPLVPELPSYIKDTTHFLRKLDDLKELPPGSLLVTLDVSSLYTNIPHKEGIEACRKLSTPLAIFPAPVSKPNPFVT